MSKTELFSLSAGQARALVAPELGGSLAGYWFETADHPVHWLRPFPAGSAEAGDVLETSGFPLIPYSNRIRDGRFAFEGRDVSLPLNFGDHPHAIHGHGWQSVWDLEDVRADSASIVYHHTADAWPWDYSARQRFFLTAISLTVELEITNQGRGDMPAGLGFHPYFTRTPEATVTAGIKKIWRVDKEAMPLRPEIPEPAEDPNRGIRVDNVALDNGFTEWRRRAVINWPEREAELIMTAEGELDFIVIFTPPGEDFFCVEPVSHATDAFNLAGAGMADTGMKVLPPGQSWKVSMKLEPRLLAS